MGLKVIEIKSMLKSNHVAYSNPLDAICKVMKIIDKNYNLGIYSEEEYNEYIDILSGMIHTKWWL